MRMTKWIGPVAGLTFALGAGLGVSTAFGQYGPPPPPPGYVQGPGWDAPPREYADEIQRRGFHDGIEGARKDYENHRAPTPMNRDEFRRPNFIAPPFRREYKEAFKRGYFTTVRHFEGWR